MVLQCFLRKGRVVQLSILFTRITLPSPSILNLLRLSNSLQIPTLQPFNPRAPPPIPLLSKLTKTFLKPLLPPGVSGVSPGKEKALLKPLLLGTPVVAMEEELEEVLVVAVFERAMDLTVITPAAASALRSFSRRTDAEGRCIAFMSARRYLCESSYDERCAVTGVLENYHRIR